MSDEQSELPYVDDAVPVNYTDCPDAAMYHDSSAVPFEEYASWRAINSNVVRWGLKTPVHFAAALQGLIRGDDTKDRKLGRAAHCFVLERDQFEKRYVVSDSCKGILKSGAREGQFCGNPGVHLDASGLWFCGQHKSACKPADDKRESISAADLERLHGISAGLKTFPPEYQKMLSRPGWSEVSIVFEIDGLKFKGRLDRYAEGNRPLILDFKKCQVGKADTESCRKAIMAYGYHIQAAIYVEGMTILRGRRPAFAWVFVEDNPPFQPNLIFADDNDISIGWEDTKRSVRMWREHPTNGYITADSDIRTGGLPAWRVQQWLDQHKGIDA